MKGKPEAEKVAEKVSRRQLETIEEEELDSHEGLQNEDGPDAGRKEEKIGRSRTPKVEPNETSIGLDEKHGTRIENLFVFPNKSGEKNKRSADRHGGRRFSLRGDSGALGDSELIVIYDVPTFRAVSR